MTQVPGPESDLLAALALALFAAVVLLFVRSPAFGVSALAGSQAWEIVAREQHPVLNLGISLYPLDLLTVCAAVAAVISMVRHPVRLHLGHAAFALFGLLVLANVGLGMARYGVQPAGNEARLCFLHLLGAAWYTATVRSDTSIDRTVTRVWIALACVYAATAVFWWLRLGIGSNSSYVWIDGQRVNSRPVNADPALIMAQAAMMLLCTPRRAFGSRLLAGPLLAAVVLLQHRSVWFAALVMGFGWLFFRPGPGFRKAAGVAAALVLGLSAVLVAAYFPGASLLRNLASSATNEDTMEWRVDSWQVLIHRLQGPADWLFGQPFGSGFDRILYGAVVDSQPHNFYLHLLLRVGLVGLCAVVLLVATMLCRTSPRDPMGLVLWLTMAGNACFCLTYAMPFTQSLLLGLLLRQPWKAPVTVCRPRRGSLPVHPAVASKAPVPQKT